MSVPTTPVSRLLSALHGRPRHPGTRRPSTRRERGDVPGWVLITLMTAALVAALWAVAEDQLVAMFRSALASVGN